MSRLFGSVLATLLLAACSTNGLVSRPGPRSGAALDRQIVLTVPQDDFSAMGVRGAPDKRYLRRRGYGATPAVERLLNQLAKEHGIERVDGWPIRSLAVYCEVFEVPEGVAVDPIIERLSADPRVDLAQPMNVFQTLGEHDDPYADLQPAAERLGVMQAHRLATGKGVLVAVIDTAVDAAHPELRGHVSMERDLVGGSNSPKEGEVHGTAVAGVIASTMDNHEGIIGVAPDAVIAALRACWSLRGNPSSARCSSFTLARALEVAIDLEPALINLSLGGPADPLLSRLLDQALGRGIVVVAAEPGPEQPADGFPASHAGVIVARASSAADNDPQPLWFPAPDREILTTTPGAGYAFFSGTSLAAAHVTGVIALLLERDPSMGVRRIADLLRATTTYFDDTASINACLALEQLARLQVCDLPLETVRF